MRELKDGEVREDGLTVQANGNGIAEERTEGPGLVIPLFPDLERDAPRASETRSLLVGISVGLLFALAARLPFFFGTTFPLNDGGMFVAMVGDLLANRFSLPAYTSYNLDNIPFAYPPLSFYLTAAISTVTHLDPVTLVRYLPLIANLATVVAVGFLARVLLGTGWAALLAPTVFAVIPRSYEWMIMGGGLTRSVGFFFAVVCLTQAMSLYRRPSLDRALICGALAGATVASHLELGVFVVYSLVAMAFLSRYRGPRAVLASIAVVALAAVYTSPWWVTVISRHGLVPFNAASLTSYWSTVRQGLDAFQHAVFPSGVFMSVLGVFALLGAVVSILRGEFFLPFWLPAVFVWVPRSAESEASVPLAILAALGVAEVVVPGLRGVLDRARLPFLPAAAATLVYRPSASLIAAQAVNLVGLAMLLVAVYSYAPKMHFDPTALGTLSDGDRQTMAWVSENTPPDSQFLVLTSGWTWEDDSAGEWFPVLAQRRSLLTPQGTEWLPAEDFSRTTCLFGSVRALAPMGKDVSYLDEWARDRGVAYTDIYISKTPRGSADWSTLLKSAESSPNYRVLVDNPSAAVLERITPLQPFAGPAGEYLISRDCQSLADQPATTQQAYIAAFGNLAAWAWVRDRDLHVPAPNGLCGRLEGVGLTRLGFVASACQKAQADPLDQLLPLEDPQGTAGGGTAADPPQWH